MYSSCVFFFIKLAEYKDPNFEAGGGLQQGTYVPKGMQIYLCHVSWFSLSSKYFIKFGEQSWLFWHRLSSALDYLYADSVIAGCDMSL